MHDRLTDPAPASAPPMDPQRLDVYAVALDFHARAATLIAGRGHAHLRDQLARASLSIVLNTAEGAGRFSPRDRARFYSMARGSACECAAVLDIVERLDPLSSADCRIARSLLVRIVQMLTRLVGAMRAR